MVVALWEWRMAQLWTIIAKLSGMKVCLGRRDSDQWVDGPMAIGSSDLQIEALEVLASSALGRYLSHILFTALYLCATHRRFLSCTVAKQD